MYIDEVPYYSLTDINDYGKPELYGVDEYYVIDDVYTMVLGSWKEEMLFYSNVRKIHHYDRLSRFKTILKCLFGGVYHDYSRLDFSQVNLDPDHVWISMRKLLKAQHATKYYNSIPILLQWIGYPRRIKITNLNWVLKDFQKISWYFDSRDWGCNYFPNMRFIALKLLIRHEADFEYRVPLLLTKRKLPVLEEVWQEFEVYLNKNDG